MKKFVISLAIISALFSTPAMAESEGRIEIRGGLATGGGIEEVFLGGATGFDFDLGEKAFAGLDLGADKVLIGGAKVLWSVGARAGIKTDDKSKLFVTGGFGFCCGESDPYAGLGFQRDVAENVYLKTEYRRGFHEGSDSNFFGVGVGVNF
jgi:opacity protein-like surface antigen